MIEHVWSVVCGRATTDRESNNISLVDVFEQLNLLGPVPGPAPIAVEGEAPKQPAVPLQFELVSLWIRQNPDEEEESVGRIRFVSPQNQDLIAHEFPVNLVHNPRMRTQLKSSAIPLAGPGRYRFVVEIRRAGAWDTVARIPLLVQSMAQVQADPVQPAG
jgi:hypothetical protein